MIARKASYRHQCLILSALVVTSVVLIFCIHTLMTNPEFTYYETIRHYKSKPLTNRSKTILLWNSFFGSRNWYLPADTVNETYFKKSRCPSTNCIMTTDRQHLPAIELFDAVFFHVAESFPLIKPVPSLRDPDQLYIFFIQESPAHTKHDLSDEQHFYNITMTYRLDSDIFIPYGYIEDIESGVTVAPALRPKWRQPPAGDVPVSDDLQKKMSTKKKLGAWFVSHCNSISRRDDLVKEIQKHVNVDVYGKCGTLSCLNIDVELLGRK